MGWSATHKRKGQALTEFFIQQGALRWSADTKATWRVLDSAFVMPAHYAAIERIDNATSERRVFASVILVKQFKEDASGHNICFKCLDESALPCESRCPARILDLLTPTVCESSNKWRAACRQRITEKRARPAIDVGTRLAYGGVTYEVTGKLGARGYIVDGCFRMKRSQAMRAEIVTCEKGVVR